MTDKKKTERQFLELVRRNVDDFPRGEPDLEHKEKPDFLFCSRNPALGIEVTRIYQDAPDGAPSLQSQEREWDLIVQAAQRLAEDDSLPPLLVDVYFSKQQPLGKRDRSPTASALFWLIKKHGPSTEGHTTLENLGQLSPEFPNAVEALSIWNFRPLTSHLWQVGDAGIVSEEFAPKLQSAINGKHAKLPAYRKKCQECWLIVVADWRGPSGFFEISDKVSHHVFDSQFERVYFLEAFSGDVLRLQITSQA